MARKTIIIIVLIIALLGTIFLVSKPLIITKRAAGDGTTTSTYLNNSYLFASPLQAKADNQEIVRVTVFILDNRGLGLANKTISISSKPNIQIIPVAPVTDQLGKAVFDFKTSLPGKYQISASLNGSNLPQTVNIVFN